MICTTADQDGCTAPVAVCGVADIIVDPEDPTVFNISHKIQMSTTSLLRKCSSSVFLARTPHSGSRDESLYSFPSSWSVPSISTTKIIRVLGKSAAGLPLWAGRGSSWGADESALHMHGGDGDLGEWKFHRVGSTRVCWGPLGQVWRPRF